MRRLTIFVVVVALIYSAYWFIGARAVTQTAESQIADLRTAGWQVEYSDLNVQGFPSRFDTSIASIDVASPRGDIGYAAPFVQALALSYQPNRVILALPATQKVTVASQTFDVESVGLRASVALAANTGLALETATAEAQSITLTDPTGAVWGFTEFLSALRESGPLPHSYDLYLNAQAITVPEVWLARFDLSGKVPPEMEIVNADVTAVLDRPLNRHTLPEWETDPGKLRGLTVKTLTLRWGAFALTGDGSITINENGVPDGTLTLRVTEWEDMLDIAIDAGLVPNQFRFVAATMGQTLSGDDGELTLPLGFTNGNMALGPIPLGPAPRFN